jgi:beta-glucanase (GH16 family)
MHFRLASVMALCAQTGFSAITLTLQDPEQKPISGVSCVQVGSTAAVTTGADGVAALGNISGILTPRQGLRMQPLFDVPVAPGDKAMLSIFDSRGKRVAVRDLRAGETFDFSAAAPGVYYVRLIGRNLNVSQSVAAMGSSLSFTGVDAAARDQATGLRKAAAEAQVTCSKTGYATKTYTLNDGDAKTIGFGVPIGRAFDPSKYAKYPGFNLEVAEDFNTNDWAQGLKWAPGYVSNDAVWEPSDGGFGGNRVRFSPDNIVFKNDAMVFRIDNAPQPASFSKSEGDNCEADGVTTNLTFCTAQNPNGGAKFAPPSDFKGAEIRTKNNHFRFGRYEITIDPPDRGPGAGTADGFIAAMFTWFTPRDFHWRENDIEVLASKTNTYLTNIFFSNKNPLWNANIESSNQNTAVPGAYDPRQAHTYAFEWLPTSVKWFVDGNLVRTYDKTTAKAGVEISQLSTKVVMNFWIMAGGAVGGAGANNQYPLETKFDNFRYYRWDNDGDKKTYPEVACLNPASQGCSKL